jgi:hypothetical protein
VDAGRLRKALAGRLFGRMAAANELLVLEADGAPLLLRVTEVNTLDEGGRQEALSYHCFRGLVTPETAIWLTAEGEGLGGFNLWDFAVRAALL